MTDTQKGMIENLQNNLKLVRCVIKVKQFELAEYLGISRATVINLEKNKMVMTSSVYIAICCLIDSYIEKDPSANNLIQAILLASNPKIASVTTIDGSFRKGWMSTIKIN